MIKSTQIGNVNIDNMQYISFMLSVTDRLDITTIQINVCLKSCDLVTLYKSIIIVNY